MFEYVPTAPDGPGFAIVTDRFLGLIGSDARASVVSELYELLEQPGTRMGDVLDIFHAPASASRFALVEVVDPVARIFQVAVRGDVLVDMRGATVDSFSGPRGANWITGEARGIASLKLSLSAGSSSAARLPLRRGVVHASEVGVRLASADQPSIERASEPHLETVRVDMAEIRRQLDEREAEPAPARVSLDRAPVQVDLARLVRPTGWMLHLPDGNTLDAAEQIVVGRRPWRSAPDETSTCYVVAHSPRREISSKHLEIRLVGEALEARDLDSANGTVVRTPDQPPRLLHGGRATQLRTGDTLDLGEGFLITVGVRG
ncbi:FHA domain-containing protein [Salinibacterium sp. ZJ77]|uniref:FHA domain-containing protein n=1 Tax=Salinibacterium sp. ZJ77 TaxID=2708337 RepID=UPI001423847D|nr:FHA domain-containing protein [Salinibacterium sp. ZJ77]